MSEQVYDEDGDPMCWVDLPDGKPYAAPSVPPSSAVQGSVRTEGPTKAEEGSERHVVDWEAERLRKWLP